MSERTGETPFLRVGAGHGIAVSRGGRVIVVADQPLTPGFAGPGGDPASAVVVTELGLFGPRTVAVLGLGPGDRSRRWPKIGWEGEGAIVVSQCDTDRGWSGRVWHERTGLEVSIAGVVGDRALAVAPDGAVEVNTGQWSAQGLAGWVPALGGWVGFDQVREAFADVPGLWAWGATADLRYVVGSNTTGPDRCLLRGPDGRVFRVMDGLAFEPKVWEAPDGRVWVTAAGMGNALRWGVWTPGELDGLEDHPSQPIAAPVAAPDFTPIEGRRFFGFVAGEDHAGGVNTADLRDGGYVVHRKGREVYGRTSVFSVTPDAFRLELEHDDRPHVITETRGGRSLAFLRHDDRVGVTRLYPEGWLYRYTLGTLRPLDEHAHAVAVQIVAYYPQPFRFRDGGGEVFEAEACVVSSLRACRGAIVWRDGVPDVSAVRPVAGNTELNFWFDHVRPVGRPVAEGRSGLGAWIGIEAGATPTAWIPWVRPTVGTWPPYQGALTVERFEDTPAGGGTGGGGGRRVEIPHISDEQFAAVIEALESQYREAGRGERGTPVDALGYGRWVTDFVTGVARGMSAAAAQAAMVRTVRAGLGLPPL